jgi:hypothetical protein
MAPLGKLNVIPVALSVVLAQRVGTVTAAGGTVGDDESAGLGLDVNVENGAA